MTGGAATRAVDVLVVGGGIAGLVAAYDVQRAGARVLLCEAGPRLGGLIRTEHVSGCLVEGGPDSLLAQKPAGLALCRELGLDAQLIAMRQPRTAFILRDGALHAIQSEGAVLGLPIAPEAIERCGMLSAEGRASLARDLSQPSSTPPPLDDESIGGFMRRRFGDEVSRVIAQPLLGGIHAGDVDRLSMRTLFPTIAEADAPGVSLLAALGSRRRRPDPDGAFRSLRGGMAVLVERLRAALPEAAVSLGTRVEHLAGAAPFQVETTAGGVTASAVVLAVPAWQAARIVSSIDPALAHQLSQISYASSATITLAYDAADVTTPLAGTGFVVPRRERATRLLAATWITSKWDDRAPAGTVLVRAFAGGVLDADLLELDDDGLANLTERDLTPILGLRGRRLFARVYRWMQAAPQYEVGHAARVAAIEAASARWPRLRITGSALRGVGIPDAVADARATVRGVLGGLDGSRSAD